MRRKEEASKVKQTTRQSNTVHPRQSHVHVHVHLITNSTLKSTASGSALDRTWTEVSRLVLYQLYIHVTANTGNDVRHVYTCNNDATTGSADE